MPVQSRAGVDAMGFEVMDKEERVRTRPTPWPSGSSRIPTGS